MKLNLDFSLYKAATWLRNWYPIVKGHFEQVQEAVNQNESALAQEIADRKRAVSDEETARSSADEALSGRIDSETAARSSADTALGERIDKEAEAREHEDNQLAADFQSDVKALRTEITDETQQRKSADDTLTAAVNKKADIQNDSGGFAGGKGAGANEGGAIGENADAAQGGAAGQGATTTFGGSVGADASSEGGGAVGGGAKTMYGGAVGMDTSSEGGGAIGDQAKATDGFSGGKEAVSKVDAIQLGTGTNSDFHTLQVYDYTLLEANGLIPGSRLPIAGVTLPGAIKLYSRSGVNVSGLVVYDDGSTVVNVDNQHGLYRSGAGQITTAEASEAEIDAETDAYKVITPRRIRHAVEFIGGDRLHTHTNKSVLDSITADQIRRWDASGGNADEIEALIKAVYGDRKISVDVQSNLELSFKCTAYSKGSAASSGTWKCTDISDLFAFIKVSSSLRECMLIEDTFSPDEISITDNYLENNQWEVSLWINLDPNDVDNFEINALSGYDCEMVYNAADAVYPRITKVDAERVKVAIGYVTLPEEGVVGGSEVIMTVKKGTATIDDIVRNEYLHTENKDSIVDAINELDGALDGLHSHANKSVLDKLTQEVIDNSHEHANKTILDELTQAVIDNSHSHANKSALDEITTERMSAWDKGGAADEIIPEMNRRINDIWLALGVTVYDGGLFAERQDGTLLDGGLFTDADFGAAVDCGGFEPLTFGGNGILDGGTY